MERAYETLRSGAWLTRERVLVVATAVLLAATAGLLYLIVTANGLVDQQGRPLGTDFSDVYAAGTLALDGHPDAAVDPVREYAREQQIFGSTTQFYAWLYPPFYLLLAAILALMPYGVALAAWQTVTLGLYLIAIRAIVIIPSPAGGGMARAARQGGVAADDKTPTPTRQPLAVDLPLSGGGFEKHDWLLLALAFPAVFINVGHGQNGFLTAALLGMALLKLDRLPLFAGILFGLLAYKPQFGMMIPLALAAGGHWRTFAAAAATVAVLAVATTLAFGWQVWPAFLDSMHFTRQVALEQGAAGWYKIQSAFAWARMWGAPMPLAYALQGTLTAALGAMLILLWRSTTPYPLKAAALCIAAFLATPYSFDYDMMALAPAVAFFVVEGQARGFRPWEKTALAALWLVPLLARGVAHATLVPLGVPAMLAVFVLLLRRSTLRLHLPMAFPGSFLLK
jgi:alpha-1,2-mannosyltransferase